MSNGCSCAACPHASANECWLKRCDCCSLLAHARAMPRGVASRPSAPSASVVRLQKRLEAERGRPGTLEESDDEGGA